MSIKYFTVEAKNGEVWIVNHTAKHIDGEPFKYKQVDKCRAEMVCEILNDLFEYKIETDEILQFLIRVKYCNSDEELSDVLKLI